MIPPVVRLLAWLCLAALMSALIVCVMVVASLGTKLWHFHVLARRRLRWLRGDKRRRA